MIPEPVAGPHLGVCYKVQCPKLQSRPIEAEREGQDPRVILVHFKLGNCLKEIVSVEFSSFICNHSITMITYLKNKTKQKTSATCIDNVFLIFAGRFILTINLHNNGTITILLKHAQDS